MSQTNSTRISRRTVVGTSLAAMAISLPAIRGHAQTPSATPGEWTFTDDKGVTVTLPGMPKNLVIDVNAAAPLWDFGIHPTALFGWNANDSGDFGDAGGNIDPEGITIVGDTTEPIKLEDVIAVEPDVIITLTWTPDDPQDYWSIDPELLGQVEAIAPIIAMSATGRADDNTERFAELASALGADLDTGVLKTARDEYNDASAAFDDQMEASSELVASFWYVDEAEVYIASPKDWADLNMYLERGMDIVEPDAAPTTFWEQLSPEQALKYPSDLFFASTRAGALSPEELRQHPTFGQHPAIKAGQVYPWNQDFIQSYQGMTQAMNAIRAVFAGAEKII